MRLLHSFRRRSRTCIVALVTVFAALGTAIATPTSAWAGPAKPDRGSSAVHFVVTATSSNTSGDSVLINNPSTNGKPDAILFATPNWNADDSCGCVYDNHAIGVWYDTLNSEWAVFNEDKTAMPDGAAFNILVVSKKSSTAFVTTAKASNISGDSTFISAKQANKHPTATLQVTQVWNPGGTGGVYNPHSIGVWYDGSKNKWAVFDEDGSTMTSSASFDVLIGSAKSGGGSLALQTATSGNTSGDSTFIDNGFTNSNPDAVVFSTPNWDPGDVCGCIYDSDATGVWYDGDWAVFNESTASMSLDMEFNLLIFTS